jgi:large subunit ribosomal protein L10
MKTRERKQEDLNALAEKLNNSKSAMIVSFNKLTVNKDQEFRNQLREAGAEYQVVKNTIARLAVKGTPYEGASEFFKGVTAIAWTENDPVVLSKTISKFIKDNTDFYTFKAGIVEGRVVDIKQVDIKQVEAIASLPSKEELISKLLFVLNAQAQRIATVINAVPRNLAIVIKQIGDAKPADQPEAKAAEPVAAPAEESDTAEEIAAAPEAATDETQAAPAEETEASAGGEETTAAATDATEPTAETAEAPAAAAEAETSPAESAAPEASSDAGTTDAGGTSEQ